MRCSPVQVITASCSLQEVTSPTSNLNLQLLFRRRPEFFTISHSDFTMSSSSLQLSALLLLLSVSYLHGMPTPATPTAGPPASGGLQADQRRPVGTNDDTTPYELLGACRATCVEQTLQWPPADAMCLQDYDCLTCWQLCEKLYEDELKWRAMCSEAECTIGCTTACKFSYNSVIVPETMPWVFMETPTTVEVNANVLHVSWEAPVPRPRGKEEPAPSGRPFLVYTLLFKDDNTQHWSSVTSTLDLITQVDGPHATFPGLQFLLVVSSPAGPVARAVPPYTLATAAPPAPVTVPPTVPVPAVADLSLEVLPTAEGRLEVEVTWLQEEWKGKYVVTWTRLSCNVNQDMPYCPLPSEGLSPHIKAKPEQTMRLLLTQITYNSEYEFTLTVEGSDVLLGHSTFYTPACPGVDATYMTCRPEPVIVVTPAPPTAAPSTASTTESTTPQTTSTTTRATTTTTTSRPTESVQPHARTAERETSSSGVPAEVLFLAAGVSMASMVLLLVGFCVYKRFCSRPRELDIAKVLQSYSQLPLVHGTATPQGSMGSLHQLHLHSIAANNLFNASALNGFGTPTHGQPSSLYMTPPPTAHLLAPTMNMTPSTSQRWPSLDGFVPVGASTPSGSRISLWPGSAAPSPAPAAVQPAVETVVTMERPTCNTPRGIQTHLSVPAAIRARSCDRLDNDLDLLAATQFSSCRAASAGDLTSSAATHRPARRQINFTQPEVSDDDTPKTGSGRHAAVPGLTDSLPSYHRMLHTVPEEHPSDISEEEEGAIHQQDRLLEWEYADFELPSFRARTETM